MSDTKMPKVLIVATSRRTRGGITSVIRSYESSDLWNKFHIHWVQTHRDGNNFRKMLYFVAAVFDFSVRIAFYDIVHLHISDGTTLIRKKIFLDTAKLLRKKVIVHFHAFDVENTVGGKRQKLYKYYFEKADCVIVLSEWWREQVVARFDALEDKVKVLYNPCSEVAQSDIGAVKDKTILYAGTVCARKGYADLIRAFARVFPNHKDWKLMIAGNGEIEQGKQLSEELGISSSVQFPGWLFGEDMESAFRSASVFCLPSYAEGFPMAVLDAWAWGLPVVTTPVGGIPDVARDGENMLLFSPGNIDELAMKLESIISDSALRDKISAASLDFSRNEFNLKTICGQLSDIYSNLVRQEGKLSLKHIKIIENISQLENLPEGKLLINTINAYSYCVARNDELFALSLKNGDALVADGKSIVWACKFLNSESQPQRRIAGWDLFVTEMNSLAQKARESGVRKRVMFMGSSGEVLSKIKERAAGEYPELETAIFSPPYKPAFDADDNKTMVDAINEANPDLLWIGMTAPKQEKWTYEHWSELNINCHVGTIGAVFDFYAGTSSRAPRGMQDCGLEWFHRLLSDPRRLWKRYLVGNLKFIYLIIKEKLHRF